MKNLIQLLKKNAPLTGTALIEDTLGSFVSTIEKLHTGIQQNDENAQSNRNIIASLNEANDELNEASHKAATVMHNLKTLMGG